jgi:hypothetical protein
VAPSLPSDSFGACWAGHGRLRPTDCLAIAGGRYDGTTASVIRRDFIELWSGSVDLYDRYLDDLEAAPVVADHARSDKLWVSYDKLSGDDLRVLLRAARNLVQRIQSEA